MGQTKREEFWNTLTHFIGIILSLVGLPLLILANNNLSSFSLASILFFEFGLLFVYTSSTLYHYVDNVELKKKFKNIRPHKYFLFNRRFLRTYLPNYSLQ